MTASEQSSSPTSGIRTEKGAIYGAGFAAVYSSSRYTTFSEKLARLALSLLGQHHAPGARLLDLACGVGAGTEVLAEAGFSAMGIDGSEEMIRRATERSIATGRHLLFECQDMRDFALDAPVDVVTCLFDALNYLVEDEDVARTFACVAQNLRPSGLFVFDVNTPHGLATRWGTRDVLSTARPDMVEINQHRYDAASRINSTITTVFIRAARSDSEITSELFERHVEIHRERGYNQEMLTGLLGRSGLTPLSFDAVPDMTQGWKAGLTPITEDTGRIMVVARKA